MISLHIGNGVTQDTARPGRTPRRGSRPAFAMGLFALAAALIVNTLLGPLGTQTIQYPISGTLLNQTIGVEAVTVGLVVPLTLTAGVLAARGHRAAPLLGFGPAAYTAYMFVQYVLGPEYVDYTSTILFHTVVFTLAAGLTISAWVMGYHEPMPQLTARRRRLYGAILLLLGAFIVSRYLPVVSDGALPAEFAQARTFFWSIFFLDLGIVVPATLVAGIGLLRGAPASDTAMYALMGWYALVPPSVAAMSVTMVINNDPHAVVGQAVMFVVVAVLVAILAVRIFLPMLRTRRPDAA
jgi:hypothetical protein